MSEEKTGYHFVDEMDDVEMGPYAVLSSSILAELPDLEADQYLVLRCARAMTAKLASSHAKGRGGWHTPGCSDEHLRRMLLEHVEKGDMVDVLNIAGMILVRQEAVQSQNTWKADGPDPISVTESTLMLGATGGVGTKGEKIKRLFESYNWTMQTVPRFDMAGDRQSPGCVNWVRED